MNDLKHSKFKNTGIIFELLTRHMVSDVLCGNKSGAYEIIRKYFKKNSELSKELTLYKSIAESTKKERVAASKYLDILLEQRTKLDSKKLKKEKYELLGSLKEKFNLDEFFSYRLPNYRTMASIYKLFESTASENPSKYVDTYETIIESMIHPPTTQQSLNEITRVWNSQPDEVKQLALNLVIEKFNSKYTNLNTKQKKLISKYINENIDSNEFRDYVYSECESISKTLKKLEKKSSISEVLKIKIREADKLLERVITSKFINDEHLSSLLLYYELVDVLK